VEIGKGKDRKQLGGQVTGQHLGRIWRLDMEIGYGDWIWRLEMESPM
jgi:hypothetical protein